MTDATGPAPRIVLAVVGALLLLIAAVGLYVFAGPALPNLGGGAPDQPFVETGTRFLDSLAQLDDETAYALLTDETKSRMTYEEFRQSLNPVESRFGFPVRGPTGKSTIGELVVVDGVATGSFERHVGYELAVVVERVELAQRPDGAWRVSSYEFVAAE